MELRARSSVGERRLDEAEVGGSIPPAPTTRKNKNFHTHKNTKNSAKTKKIKGKN
jgi:hypothetical protein